MMSMTPRSAPPGDAMRWLQRVLQQLQGRRSVPQAARLDRPASPHPRTMPRADATTNNPFDVQRTF
jgi:hypothetical protein